MVFLNTKSRHAEWRKVVKKLRRKRIRQERALERDRLLEEEQKQLESQPEYQKWLQDHQQADEEREREEKTQSALREKEWRRAEQQAQKQWREIQKKLAQAREEKLKQNLKIKLEWEKEQERLKQIQLAKEKEQEEKRLQQVAREKQLLDFLEQGGDTPEHLKTKMESNPGKTLCPFFEKVAACRFFDVCSRNHVRPGISRTLLINNFFSDISLEIKENEHGSDSSLEFEKHEVYKHYQEFFYDVVTELEKSGKIKTFITCCNHEAHLRGNVYVQYGNTREALVSYHKFNGRWYAGKQLNVEFCNVACWGSAICGLFSRNKCPKGNSCNFLHVFQNPKRLYSYVRQDSVRRNGSVKKRDFEDSWEDSSDRRSWRWSESPERKVQKSDRRCRDDRKRRRSRSSDRRSSSRRKHK